ncbi:cobyrinic acid A,C-diamide synthase [Halorhodospira halochloris]|uniref:Cobyrinic acid A,C-diamide synthase n=1 Tax=Halorhodospira halochloris TaxID=1052 RepID=A0A110B5Q8_HALHR|nr:cobyrinate a,c-diamide synthase [Halorhodospira halochloris]MBK1652201.1 cobyrinic acid a,c-diamide synthase [Halorhodospira halochloris]BAU58378.1 cobyrinic acid A,C-diamide synthase [Halorhodospira halochloris]
MSRIYISALHKSSGKTTLAIGITAALSARDVTVQPYKRGPDYIDPGWLSLAAGRPCHNLDFHTQSTAELLSSVAETAAQFALIEGNKGLHDGTDAQGKDSNAALAALLQTPVVLVVDCRGMTRGIAPTLLGHSQFDPRIQVSGVILNRVAGSRHERKLRQAVEQYTDISVLGAIPDQSELAIAAPYLGLVPAPEQREQAQRTIRTIAAVTAEHVDLEQTLSIGRLEKLTRSDWLPGCEGRRESIPGGFTAPSLAPRPSPRDNQSDRWNPASCPIGRKQEPSRAPSVESHPPPRHYEQPSQAEATLRLGVAYDQAFNFYYPGDLQALQAAGAELVWIDMLSAPELPPQLDGLLIGGGFPERHAAALAANESMRASVSAAALVGLPIYAECGGLMYLCQHLTIGDATYPMAGLFPLTIAMNRKPQGHGYVRLQVNPSAPWSPAAPGQNELPAHEFHYSALAAAAPRDAESTFTYAYQIQGGSGLGNGHDGLVKANTMASYAHLRHTQASPWADNFIAFLRRASKTTP